MCGILGQFGEGLVDEKLFVKALKLMEHRGPDAHKTSVGTKHIFGHRRLSIIDLNSRSDQPLQTADGRFEIVFNGEIYNYLELRTDLKKMGIEFYSDGDTEVLLKGFELEGIEFIQKCNGMFSVGLIDKLNGSLTLVRDRLGIKPLFYRVSNENIIFSSEIKSILEIDDRPKKLNESAIFSYFAFRYPIGTDTFFEGIHSVEPGTYMIFDEKLNQKKKTFWDLSKCVTDEEDLGEEYYKEEISRLLEDSVKIRMRSDVQFGAYLSGGVDSSLVTAIMAKNSDKPIKTFTIAFAEEGYSELEFAKIVSDKYSTTHHEISIDGDEYFKTLDFLVQKKDAPLSVPNEVPLFLMSKELKKHITVVLSGEGADEIFGGYGRIFGSAFDFEMHNDSLDESIRAKFKENYGRESFASELDHFLANYPYSNEDRQKKIFADSKMVERAFEGFRNDFKSQISKVSNSSYLTKMMFLFETRHLPGLLARLDLSTMATSVEGRVPFVDYRLVELAFKIPNKYKLKWNDEKSRACAESGKLFSKEFSEELDIPKYILKKVGEKYLPESILYRKKMGFPVPLNDWFGGDFADTARELLLSGESRSSKYFNKSWVESTVAMGKNMAHADAMKIWMAINLELFLRRYF